VPTTFGGLRCSRRIVADARRAFTILEVLLTIALIALLAGSLVGGAAHLLSDKPVTADEVFWKAVQEARKAALKSEKEVRLRFDGKAKQFVLIDGFAPSTLGADGFTKEETVIKQIPVPPPGSDDLTIEFLGSGKGGPLILIGGMAVESQPISYVTFYPDGTCTAFRAQVVRHGGTHTLAVDPWTCAAILPDPNARPL
jgi:prepilin-type N-terminal cleavage/methylation domain-containing protein